jgi:hypothetical protein
VVRNRRGGVSRTLMFLHRPGERPPEARDRRRAGHQPRCSVSVASPRLTVTYIYSGIRSDTSRYPSAPVLSRSVMNGEGKILREVSNLERTGAERYREVYERIPEYTKRDERQGRGPAAISQEREETKVFLYKRVNERVKLSVNYCVKKKALTMYMDALYRGVGQNVSTPDNTESPLVRYQSDDGENQRQAETSKDKQD